MAAIVIADASPLIALAHVNGLGCLEQLFSIVMLTDVVLAEVPAQGWLAADRRHCHH